MENYKRNSVYATTKEFCHFANENDYIEVTEWKNGEGFDADISSRGVLIRLTWGEYRLLKKLVKELKSLPYE